MQSVQNILEPHLCSKGGGSEAVMEVDNNDAARATTAAALGGLVPGSAGGEGCFAAGGCATCPL
jgi:hypothetical protein